MKETESNNARTRGFSSMDTEGMLRCINEEDKTVAYAVERAIPFIAAAVDGCYERVRRGGRVFYVGCGTSGRLGMIDASEIGCTYGEDGIFFAVVAGGMRHIADASAGDEDSFSGGRRAISMRKVNKNDVVVGLSASGSTPYVCGALAAANEAGALTVGIVNNEQSDVAAGAHIPVVLRTGAEAIEGSTRMKAGTAQKMTLNMISTALMAKLGRVYGNYMVHMRPYNEKLRRRAVSIVTDCAACGEEEALAALKSCDWQVARAVDKISQKGEGGLSAPEQKE